MIQLELSASLPCHRKERILQILAGHAAMAPEPIEELHILLRPIDFFPPVLSNTEIGTNEHQPTITNKTSNGVQSDNPSSTAPIPTSMPSRGSPAFQTSTSPTISSSAPALTSQNFASRSPQNFEMPVSQAPTESVRLSSKIQASFPHSQPATTPKSTALIARLVANIALVRRKTVSSHNSPFIPSPIYEPLLHATPTPDIPSVLPPPSWDFIVYEPPRPNRRPVLMRTVTSTRFLSGNIPAYISDLGYSYIKHFLLAGNYLVLSHLVIRIYEIFQFPEFRLPKVANDSKPVDKTSATGPIEISTSSQSSQFTSEDKLHRIFQDPVPHFSELEPLDSHRSAFLEVYIRLPDDPKSELLSAALNELESLRKALSDIVELVVPDKKSVDSSVSSRPSQPV